MAWIRCCGGSQPKPTDLFLINNSNITWVTTSDAGSPTTNYIMLPTTSTLQSNQGTYTTTKLTSDLLDFTNKSSLVITGSAYLRTQSTGSASVNCSIAILDANGTVIEQLFTGSASSQTGDRTISININKDISSYTGNFKLQFTGFSWNPNYVRYTLNDCTLYK